MAHEEPDTDERAEYDSTDTDANTTETVDIDGDGQVPLTRRSWLKASAALGAGGLFTAAGSGTAAAATWESDADSRIQSNRVTDLEVTVEDTNGNTVSDAEVKFLQLENDFGFATALTAKNGWMDYALNENWDADWITKYRDLFNSFIPRNIWKWTYFQDDGSDLPKGLNMANWATNRGKWMHSHTAMWQLNDGPDDLETEYDNGNASYVKERCNERSREAITWCDHLDNPDMVEDFQVMNEQPRWNKWTDLINPNQSAVEADVLQYWHNTAESANTNGKDIYTNSFNFGLEVDKNFGQYETLVSHLMEAALDGVGFQGHHWNSGDGISSADMISTLDDFASLGDLEFAVTEYDYQSDFSPSEGRADYFYRYLKTFYSHPDTVMFNMWGFWEGIAGKTPPLFNQDWSPKPGFYEYIDLVFDQFHESDTKTTDTSGVATEDVHLGEYHVQATDGSNQGIATVTVDDASATKSVTVTLDGSTAGWDATGIIHAEDHDDSSGVQTYSDTVGYFDSGDWLRYDDVDFGDGVDYFQAFVGTGNPGNDIEVRLDGTSGTKIATLTVDDSGSYSQKYPQGTQVTADVSGTHDLYLVGAGGSPIGNLDYITFYDDPVSDWYHFYDRFERYATLGPDWWTAVGNADVGVTDTVAEEGEKSAYIDGPDAGGIRADTIDTSGFSSLTVDFWAKAGDSTGSPESGEELYAEWKDAGGNWTEFDRITSWSAGQEFDRSTTITDSGAFHDGFEIRFMREASSGGDRWLVDTVKMYTKNWL